MVQVSCMTFNHSAFIEDAMNGFCIQKTNFPFVCTIIDDCSTDGEQQVINNYLQTNFDLENNGITRNEETNDYKLIFSRHKSNNNCYFAVLFLKYNHYKKKSKLSYIEEWKRESKYFAICEGDDYWIDSSKLQKQVDFLEKHPEFTLVCSRTKLYSETKQKFIGENYCYDQDSIVEVKDVIYRSGLFISTCSIVYRKEVKDNYPDYCRKCAVGDYPLQIMAAMKGKIYYFNDNLSVYRVQNPNSWMGRQKWASVEEKSLARLDSMLNMFKGFSKDYPKYSKYFKNKIIQYLITGAPFNLPNNQKDIEYYNKYYKNDIQQFPIWWWIIYKLKFTNIPILRGYYVTYTEPIFKRFRYKHYIYKK